LQRPVELNPSSFTCTYHIKYIQPALDDRVRRNYTFLGSEWIGGVRISSNDLIALGVTLKLAAITAMLLLLIGLPIAWYLSRTKNRFRPVFEALIALPLVLPPTVLGFYLLISFAPDAPLGAFWQMLTGQRLAFSFEGLVLGSMIYSLPFVVQPLQVSFSSIPSHLLDSAATMGAKPLDRFFSIVLPLSRPGIITAITLGFAHTMGEFGVVLMIGGNIPGETQVMSIALYDHVESLAYAEAHTVSLALLVISFVVLLFTYSRHHNQLRFGFNR